MTIIQAWSCCPMWLKTKARFFLQPCFLPGNNFMNNEWLLNKIYFFEFCEKIAKFQYNTNICSVMHCTMKNFISKLLQEKIIFIPFRNEEFFFTNDEKQFSSSFFWNSFPLCAAVYAAARKVGDGLVYGNIVTNSETLWLPSRCLVSKWENITPILLHTFLNNFFSSLIFFPPLMDTTWFPAVLTYKPAPRPLVRLFVYITPIH